jgi:hypothetical protein
LSLNPGPVEDAVEVRAADDVTVSPRALSAITLCVARA